MTDASAPQRPAPTELSAPERLAPTTDGGPVGPVMVIGGAEDKLGERIIISRFVQLAGGDQARIAVISTASSLGDAATELYRQVFARVGAAKVTGISLAARSTPRITSHLASIVARSRTLVGPHVFRGQVASTVRPFRVGRRRTFTAGHLPGIEIVGAARTSASGVVATVPATSDGPPGGVTKRPSWQNDGFGTRADATPASVRTSVATARRIVMPTPRS